MVVWELRRCVLPEPQDLSRWDLVEHELAPGLLFAGLDAAKTAAQQLCGDDGGVTGGFGQITWDQVEPVWQGVAGEGEPEWFCQITPVEVR